MKTAHPTPILNTTLPPQFRQIRIHLAREPGHPEGDAGVAYVIVAPLDADERIDPKLWREHREACRITRLRPDRPDHHGHLVRRQGGGWAFHYESGANMPDEKAARPQISMPLINIERDKGKSNKRRKYRDE